MPVFSIGSNSSETCSAEVERVVAAVCRAAEGYDTVVNGRFKGGWTTRHYGQPATGIHAIQMELAQRAYMNEAAPWEYRQDKADGLREVLSAALTSLESLASSGEI